MEQTDTQREHALAHTFVRMADTLVSGFDLVELFDDLVRSSVEIFQLAAAGVVLADQRGALHVMASSSEEARLIEVFELQSDEGPCLEAYRTGRPVAVTDADDQLRRWPTFSAHVADAGLGPAYAVPMRLRDQTIGAINVFRSVDDPLPIADLVTVKAMADVATIAVLQYRSTQASVELAQQLQGALDSRVMIEQAKGVLAERGQVDMEVAFTRLRAFARRRNLRLAEVAEEIAHGRLSPELPLAEQAPGETG